MGYVTLFIVSPITRPILKIIHGIDQINIGDQILKY